MASGPSSLIANAARKAAALARLDRRERLLESFSDCYGHQRRTAREVFIRFRPRRREDGLTVPMQLQMILSERLPGGSVIRQGIGLDPIGWRVAYHFFRRHLGEVTDPGLTGGTLREPTAEVSKVMDPIAAGQLCDVSWFALGIVEVFLLDPYDDATLERSRWRR